MSVTRIAGALIASSLLLQACSGTTGEKETAGTLLGAVGGAFAGSQVGGGSGQIVATAAGAILGMYLGNEIGASLDRADEAYARQAQDVAHQQPIGGTVTWNNPESGNHGSFTPVRDGQDQYGNYCREYQTTVTVGGEQQSAYGTACRQPDGSWAIVGS